MHIIIDIRDAHSFSSMTERYGETWGALWKRYHPHDSITYLIFESQHAKTEHYIKVPKGHTLWWRKKKIMTHTGNEIFRCVNFSNFAPYSNSIPTLSHIFHNRPWLYPHDGEDTYIAKKALEYKMHRIAHNSNKIIVPSMSVGLECVELWGMKEHTIEIIPYFPLEKQEIDELTPIQYQINSPFFLYDGSFGSEGNIIGMLKGFEAYKHIHGGKMSLILHGSLGHELSNITQMIRAFDLTEHIKLVGTLEGPNLEWFYTNAQAWIMVGSYYSGGPRVELAYAHSLPLILSDVSPLRGYGAIYIHPNHITEELTPALIRIERNKVHQKRSHEYDGADIIRAYELHLSETKH